MHSRTSSEENIVLDVGKESFSVQGFQEKILSAVTSVTSVLTGSKSASDSTQTQSDTLKRNYAFSEKNPNDIPKAPEDEFVFSVPKNHLMSPYLCPDDILRQFPKTNIITTIIDPCVDDCIEFSKKLRSLNVDIELDILGALNHGFLNFAHVNLLLILFFH